MRAAVARGGTGERQAELARFPRSSDPRRHRVSGNRSFAGSTRRARAASSATAAALSRAGLIALQNKRFANGITPQAICFRLTTSHFQVFERQPRIDRRVNGPPSLDRGLSCAQCGAANRWLVMIGP
jgi:hypothetical protein